MRITSGFLQTSGRSFASWSAPSLAPPSSEVAPAAPPIPIGLGRLSALLAQEAREVKGTRANKEARVGRFMSAMAANRVPLGDPRRRGVQSLRRAECRAGATHDPAQSC